MGKGLIPDVAQLTEIVLGALKDNNVPVVEAVTKDLVKKFGSKPNIEAILSRVRLLSQAMGSETAYGLTAEKFEELGKVIAGLIGKSVGPKLPPERNAYSELIAWIAGTNRECPVEIFTPNYDLLFEEAFEQVGLPYFDGFAGGYEPFFDPPSVANDHLPARWSRLWKLHGSLGWEVKEGRLVRTGSRTATEMIYPDHMKYDKMQQMPYSALFERLRTFLRTPDCLLICTGFSFFDAHISDVITDALTANPHAAVFAFQFHELAKEQNAVRLAEKRPNLSVYARDGAVISGIKGNWRCGQSPTKDWPQIRETFWGKPEGADSAQFMLGDFANLARFFALAHAVQMAPTPVELLAELLTAASEGGADATK